MNDRPQKEPLIPIDYGTQWGEETPLPEVEFPPGGLSQKTPLIPIDDETLWGEKTPGLELYTPAVCPGYLPVEVQTALAIRDLPLSLSRRPNDG